MFDNRKQKTVKIDLLVYYLVNNITKKFKNLTYIIEFLKFDISDFLLNYIM